MAVQFDMAEKAGVTAPVERLIRVDEVERIQTGRFQSHSLPGHLLHIVTAGAVSQWAEGRPEVFGKGAVVWYHENEPVRGEILRAPWRFITINFHAPAIPPPPDDRRVLRAGPVALRLGRKLLALWRDPALPLLERQLRCHRALFELLQHLLPRAGFQPTAQPGAKHWWRIEKQLRARLEETRTLADVQRLSGLSVRTVIRVCKAATGVPPMKRLKEIRLSYARGLVQHSDLPITEIAFRVGYARSQELSRDYHQRFGFTPREDRRRPPGYRRLERPNAGASGCVS
jgi:AraC-like DNA-binding protein